MRRQPAYIVWYVGVVTLVVTMCTRSELNQKTSVHYECVLTNEGRRRRRRRRTRGGGGGCCCAVQFNSNDESRDVNNRIPLHDIRIPTTAIIEIIMFFVFIFFINSAFHGKKSSTDIADAPVTYCTGNFYQFTNGIVCGLHCIEVILAYVFNNFNLVYRFLS